MGFYYDFENADAFATGAIGQPGDRTFYVQIRADGRTVSVKCEKQQVAALAEYLRTMLADMPDTSKDIDTCLPRCKALLNKILFWVQLVLA